MGFFSYEEDSIVQINAGKPKTGRNRKKKDVDPNVKKVTARSY